MSIAFYDLDFHLCPVADSLTFGHMCLIIRLVASNRSGLLVFGTFRCCFWSFGSSMWVSAIRRGFFEPLGSAGGVACLVG